MAAPNNTVAKELGIGALIVVDGLGLAGRFSRCLEVLGAGRVCIEGPLSELLISAHLKAACDASAVIDGDGRLPCIIPKKLKRGIANLPPREGYLHLHRERPALRSGQSWRSVHVQAAGRQVSEHPNGRNDRATPPKSTIR